jgi:DNA-binding SARP family transcriptional activator
MFGRVAVLRDGEPLSMLSKSLELLCYLVLHRERAHTRETLAGLLWPDAPPAQARKYLRQSLWQLQTNLAVSGGPGTVPMLDVSAARVRVHPDASWWCDVDVVERAHRIARDVPAGALSDHNAAAVEHAAALCQDDLLDTWGQDWCVRERDRLQLVHLDLLDRLTEHAVCCGLLRRGLAHGQRLLRLDPAREVTHRQLMRLYAACGDRTGALRQYGRCVQALAEEFDLAPSAETVELYRRIRGGSLESTGADVPPEPPGPREPLDERLDRIADAVVALRNDVGLLLALHRGNPEERREAWETG